MNIQTTSTEKKNYEDDPSRKYGEQVKFYQALVTVDVVADTPKALLTSAAVDGADLDDGILSDNVVDGTNRTALLEWKVSMNDFVPATGAAAGLQVRLYRTSTEDNDTHIDATITEASQVSIPYKTKWGNTGYYVTANQTATLQLVILLAFYTPYTPS